MVAREVGVSVAFDLAVPTETGGCWMTDPTVLLWWLKANDLSLADATYHSLTGVLIREHADHC